MTGKRLIPDDWDNESWVCVQIQWPKSTLWLGILRGILHEMSRGRTWDETTGVIKDVQVTGREIVDKNNPLVSCCADCNDAKNGDDDYLARLASIFDGCSDDCDDCDQCDQESEENMGCCKLRWNGKTLEYLECGEWRAVPGAEDSNGLPPDSGIEVPPPETPTQVEQYACAKASAAVNVLWNVMNAIFDHWNDWPWEYIKAVEDAATKDLDNEWLTGAQIIMAEASAPGSGINMADIIINNPKQQVICDLAQKISGDTSSLTERDWNLIFNLTYDLSDDPIQEAFLSAVIQAIGRNDFNSLAQMAVQRQDFDCACPEVVVPDVPIPVTHTWAHSYDLTNNVDALKWRWGRVDPKYSWVEGEGFKATGLIQYDYTPFIEKIPDAGFVSGTAAFKWAYLDVTWPSSTTYADEILMKVFNVTTPWNNFKNETPVSSVLYANSNLGPNQVMQANKAQLTQPTASGDAAIRRIIIAGTGTDPYPGDPQYIP